MAVTSAQDLFEQLQHVKIGGTICMFSKEKCEALYPTIQRIQELKKEKSAIILAHSYISPEIVVSVADFTGDSYELSKKAKETDASSIVFCAVRFMAETAKLLNPNKEVLIPSKLNGCSLADSITGEDVRNLRAQYPDYTFVCYINTSAAVKAECDVCVTSSNVYKIIEAIPNRNILFLPDKLMGENIKNYCKEKGLDKHIVLTDGTCYVHEEYDPDMIRFMRQEHPGLKVASHPECSPSVLAESDFVGSTAQMINYVKHDKADTFFLLTECGLSGRLQVEAPGKKFVGTCTMCKYMKSNTLKDILRVLENHENEDVVEIEEETQQKALKCLDQMFFYADSSQFASLGPR